MRQEVSVQYSHFRLQGKITYTPHLGRLLHPSVHLSWPDNNNMEKLESTDFVPINFP